MPFIRGKDKKKLLKGTIQRISRCCSVYEKRKFKSFVEENNFIQVNSVGKIYSSCGRLITRITSAMRVPMHAHVIARIKRRRLSMVLEFCNMFMFCLRMVDSCGKEGW